MKKATMETILTALTDLGYDNAEILAELTAEVNKGAEEKAARAAAYEAIHDLVIDNLSDVPVTCKDLYTEIEGDLPDDMRSQSKIQYALGHLWQEEIVKIPGKPNTYRRA